MLPLLVFVKTLDAEMKRLKAGGLGVHTTQAEPITPDKEELLWSKNLLGAHSPQTLLDTLVYLCGMYFALRSVKEHRDLKLQSFELVERTGEVPYIVYRESVSKNHPGGLKNRHDKAKVVIHHANTEQPDRCLIQFFKKYCEHCPEGADDVFYLTPIQNPKYKVWYKVTPVGENTLAKTFKHLCGVARIQGHKTNHSLRITAATRLFHEGVDEMERTGHKSLDGVRAYKLSSEKQHGVLSSILNTPATKVKVDQPPKEEPKEVDVDLTLQDTSSVSNKDPDKSTSRPTVLVAKENMPNVNFSGCSNVSVNYYFK